MLCVGVSATKNADPPIRSEGSPGKWLGPVGLSSGATSTKEFLKAWRKDLLEGDDLLNCPITGLGELFGW